MKIRNTLAVLSSAALLVLANNSFAADAVCPSPKDLRSLGSSFSYAYQSGPGEWIVISQPFGWKAKTWQTSFTIHVNFPTDSEEMIDEAKDNFSRTPLASEPTFKSDDQKTVCYYTPEGANFEVVAMTPAGYGIRR